MDIGFFYFFAERYSHVKPDFRLGIRETLVIGIAQATALLPGISRSGMTISTGVFQGMKRSAATRFSFLLGAPAIFGAGVWTALSDFLENGSFFPGDIFLTAIGFFSALLTGLFAVSFLMFFVKKYSLRFFGYYLIIVGAFSWLFPLLTQKTCCVIS